MRFRVDTSELDRLVADFEASPARFARGARGVMSKAGVNIKKDLQREARGSGIPEARMLARDISYDLDGLDLVVGPEKQEKPSPGHGGSFAFLYYGNSKNGPVLPDPVNALDREAGNVADHLGDVAEDVL